MTLPHDDGPYDGLHDAGEVLGVPAGRGGWPHAVAVVGVVACLCAAVVGLLLVAAVWHRADLARCDRLTNLAEVNAAASLRAQPYPPGCLPQ